MHVQQSAAAAIAVCCEGSETFGGCCRYVWLPFFVTQEQHTTVHALQSTSVPEHRHHEVRCHVNWLDAWRISTYVSNWLDGDISTEEPRLTAHV